MDESKTRSLAHAAGEINPEWGHRFIKANPSGCLAVNDALRSFNVVRVLQDEYR